jgi:hypothetical protein
MRGSTHPGLTSGLAQHLSAELRARNGRGAGSGGSGSGDEEEDEDEGEGEGASVSDGSDRSDL